MRFKRLFLGIFFIAGLIQISSANDILNILEPKEGVIIDKNVNFRYAPMSVSGNYQIQVSADIQFNSIIYDTITASTSFATVIPVSGKYYWRARIRGGNFRSDWTSAISFTIVNPSGLGNLLVWYSAQTGTPAIGNPLPLWQDQSANANNAQQANAGLQPTVQSGGTLLNNKKVVRFDGTDDFMAFNKITTARSMFFLIKNRTGTQGNYPAIMGDDVAFDFHSNDGTLLFWAGITSSNIINGQGYVNKAFKAPGNMLKYSNYSLLSFVTLGNVTTNYITNDRNVGGRVWDGDYAEILLYSDTLNPQIREDVENYILNKYAPPVAIKDTVIGNSFCTPVTLTAPGNYTNYTWSTGATTPTVSVPPNSNYSVITKDIFGQQSTTTFNAFPYARLNNAKVFICQGDTFKVDLKTPAGFSALWNTGATTTKLNISQTGQYSVKVTDGSGCFVYDTINVVVDNPQLSPSPDVSGELRVCFNEKLFLTSPTAFDSIRWSTGSGNVFIPITVPGAYTAYGRTTTGCVINKSFNITIAGEAPVAKFGTSSVCQSTATVFTDSSTTAPSSTIVNWKWSFGDGNVATSGNPENTYTNLGSYTVTFKITTNQGCSDSIAKTIIVNKRPVPSFYNLLSCSGNTTTFVDQSIANSAAVTDWSWDFAGLGTSTGIQNPYFSFPASGTYNVRLTATNTNGCKDTATIQTIVYDSPVSAFSYDSVCGLTAVTFKFLSTVAPPSTIPPLNWGKWDFGDGTIETAIRNPQHSYTAPGIYDVSLIVNSSNQCVDTVVKQIKVFDYPVVDFTVSQTQCTGKEIQFTDVSATPDGTPVSTWNWFFSGQGTSTQQNPRFTFNEQGNYTIQLTAKNTVGCSGTKLRSIAVSAPPTPKFTFSPNGIPAPVLVTYANQSSINGNYIWDYGDGSALVEAYNPPQHQYTVNGTYPIKLIATDFRGCTDTLTKYILVDKAYLDGVMASVSIIPNGDFYKIQVSVINNSNIEITALGLSIQLGGGAVIRENWTGSLLPGQTTVYLFTGEIKIGDNGQIPVVCASIDNINNNAREDRTDNNTTCKEVKVGSFDILNIYPNPAYENINFGVMIPKDGRVNIRFIDILGQQMYSKDFDAVKGYNSLTMSTMPLNAAVYVAEVSFDGEIIRKKFMRKDRK